MGDDSGGIAGARRVTRLGSASCASASARQFGGFLQLATDGGNTAVEHAATIFGTFLPDHDRDDDQHRQRDEHRRGDAMNAIS